MSDPTPGESTPPFQFTLRHLLVLMVASSFVFAAIFQWGLIGLAVIYVLSCLFAIGYGAYRGSWGFVVAGAVMVVFGWCMGLDFLILLGHGRSGRRMQCSNHLKQIGLALHNYHDTYGSFPPAYIADSTGKPIHSWRVLILPFMEQKPLYDRYSFNEPWDGPNNSKLHSEAMNLFACPTRPKQQAKVETSYVVVLGPQTMWPGAKAIQLSDLTDDTSNTLMVVELANSGIHWMEPRDLHIVQMPMAINAPRGQGISSQHPNAALAVFADGHTAALPNTIPPETLRALLTIAGNETIGDY